MIADRIAIPPLGGVGRIVLVSGTSKTAYSTIAAALAAAVSGDMVLLGPGTYAESVTVPAGVFLMSGHNTSELVRITGAAATGTRITLNNGSAIGGFLVTVPTDAVSAVKFAGNVNAACNNIGLLGSGGSGIGFSNEGNGFLLMPTVYHIAGAVDTIFKITAGNIYMINGITAAPASAAIVTDIQGGTMSMSNFTSDASATIGIRVNAGNFVGSNIDIRNATRGMYITSASANVSVNGYRAKFGVTDDLVIDSGLGAGPTVLIQGELRRDRVRYSGDYTRVSLAYLDNKEDDEALVIDSELAVGRPELGREAVIGEGDSYTRDMVVLTTDSSAAPGVDGGNLTDVSTAAQSASGSTFTFQGVTAGHAILVGSAVSNGGDVLKHWGLKIKQTTAAAEVTPKSFIFEVWNGAAWAEINIMATHSTLWHRYGNEVFIRANTSEHIRYGINGPTVWAKKIISGQNLYWARIRVATTVTTAPVFEQFKLSTSRFEANPDGTNTYHGRARFRKSLLATGNIFGEEGGVGDADITVGTGGIPTQWDHRIKNSELNGNGDAIHAQFILPRGIDTGQPLDFNVTYIPTTTGADPITLILSAKPLECQGNLIADPAGGVTPINRTLANTQTRTGTAAQAQTDATVPAADDTRFQCIQFTGYNIANHYEGDIVLVRLELDNDGATSNANIAIATLEVSGVMWTHGEKQ